MNAATGGGRSRYLDGKPAIELWGVSQGQKGARPVCSCSAAKQARRRDKELARQARMRLKQFVRAQKAALP